MGPRLEETREGRFVSSAVNGLIGDRLLRERPQMAIPMALRLEGRDVAPDAAALSAAYPDATGRLVVFLHGLCENESYWWRRRETSGPTYAEALTGGRTAQFAARDADATCLNGAQGTGQCK